MSDDEILAAADVLLDRMGRRHTVREFSPRPVPRGGQALHRSRRDGAERLEALGPIGTDPDKPFLEIAPWLIAIFTQRHYEDADGRRIKHYYATESVGIATGMLIAALHEAGLATLTYTPNPMSFLNEALGRPDNEKPFLLLVVGHPAVEATVPAHAKQKLALSSILSER